MPLRVTPTKVTPLHSAVSINARAGSHVVGGSERPKVGPDNGGHTVVIEGTVYVCVLCYNVISSSNWRSLSTELFMALHLSTCPIGCSTSLICRRDVEAGCARQPPVYSTSARHSQLCCPGLCIYQWRHKGDGGGTAPGDTLQEGDTRIK